MGLWILLQVEFIKVLQRIIDICLNQSLFGFSIFQIKNFQIVLSLHMNAISIWICLIKSLSHSSFVIIHIMSSLLHQLNSSWLQSASSLCSVIHDREYFTLFFIFHGNCCIYWIIICCDVFIRFLVVVLNVPSWSKVENSFLHF